MADVLEEVTSPDLTREHVQRRLDDWVKRLDELYTLTRDCLPPLWKATPGPKVVMHEEIMREFDIPPLRLPSLVLEKDSQRRGLFQPRGLWIIGANGRVDVTIGNKHLMLVDKAENFMPPNWQIASIEDRQLAPFNRIKLHSLLVDA